MIMPQVSPSGLQAAERCGRDFILAGMTLDDLPVAMSFCEHPLEMAMFVNGMCQELTDLHVAQGN